MRFYEVREADDELALGITLAHETPLTPDEFAAMVREAREEVLADYAGASLAEAVAAELERSFGFSAALEHRLVAVVSVSDDEAVEPALIGASAGAPDEGESDDADSEIAADLLAGRAPTGLRTALIDLDAVDRDND